MKKLFYPLTLALTLLATSCTNNQDDMTPPTDPSGKTPISFVGEATTAPARTRAGFTADTKIAMRIKSTDGTNTIYTRAVATAKEEKNGSGYSEIELADKRYWDDAYGRTASLSVYAIAVPEKSFDDFEKKLSGGTSSAMVGTTPWFTESPENENISWSVTTSAQTQDLINAEDLTYSNNIQSGGSNGVYRYDFEKNNYSNTLTGGCMKFAQKSDAKTDDPGKFDKGHLVFKHALSRIKVTLTKGEGFGSDAFEFESDKNVTIKNVPVSGTLDLTTGTWKTTTTDFKDIEKMYQSAAVEHTSYTLMAQMLPDYVISDGSAISMLTFKIDDNQYNITQDQMFDALKAAADADNKTKALMSKLTVNNVTMEQGINYIFNIKVNKTGVNLTANVVDFANVTANDIETENDHVTLSLTSISGSPSTSFDLYRSVITSGYDQQNWGGNYEKHSAALTSKGGNAWSTDWFFDSNLTYYHFRIVNSGITVITKDNDTDVDDYFTINAGPVSSTDYHWGAPMKSQPKYDQTKGYADHISLAIGATSDAIGIADMHVLSNIKVQLETTNDGAAVNLNGSKVTITKIHGTGKVLLGNGLVTRTGNTTVHEMTPNSAHTEFTYAVVPQELVRSTVNDNYVGITIETGDGNKYYIVKQLSDITASSVDTGSIQEKDGKISSWLPGYSYTYKFKLKKTGITDITCTVSNWVEVEAKETGVSLE